MQDTLVPVIDSLQQEFFVTRSLVPILSWVNEYGIPPRALGRKLREVKVVSPSGGRADFPKIAVEREQFYRASGTPFGFYFYGDKIVVVPVPQADGYSLQLWWFLGPGKLVPVSDACTVVSFTFGPITDDVVVSSVPATIFVNSTVDFIQGVSGNSSYAIDRVITAIAGTTLSFALGQVPTDIAVGDYLSIAQTAPIVQIPDPAEPYLVTLTAMEVLQAIGDFEGRDALKETRDLQDKNLKLLLEPRVEGESTPIINDYGFVGGPRRGLWGIWGGSV
jgi:hypothetical protein